MINTVKGNCPTEKLVTTGAGLYKSNTDPGRLIYRGQDPNNRILLSEDGTNTTLYRIVSYEIDGTIKVVRDDKLSSNMAWDERDSNDTTTGPRKNAENTYCNYGASTDEYKGCNAWGTGSNTLYNGESLGNNFHYVYYANNATTMTNGTSGTVTINSTLNTYLNNTWLPTSLTNYIDNHSWNVGGIYYTTDDKGIIKEKEEEKQLKWIGKVGLLNITEYVEASTNPDCTSAKSNYGSATGSPCLTDNWTMYNKTFQQWPLSPYSKYRYIVWIVYSTGYFSNTNAYNTSISVRPAFYLKAGLSISGTGATGTEYTID